MTIAPSVLISEIEAQAERRLTPCGRGSMVWRSWGQGPPLLLLHGASGSWMHWIRNIVPLAERFRVIAPDLPGFGDSDASPDPQNVDSLTGAVASGLERILSPPQALQIAGFSFGGIVGGLVAARMGPRIRTLVLSGAGGMATPQAPIPSLLRTRPGMRPDEVASVHRENLHTLMLADPRNIDDLAVHVQMENIRKVRFKSGSIPSSDRLLRVLPDIRARLCGIWGDRDVFAAPDVDARRRLLAGVQPHLDFRVIEAAGHWVIYEAAPQVNQALMEMFGDAL